MSRKGVVITVVAIVLLLPLAAVAALVLVAQSEWGERWLEKQVAARIHRQVDIERIRLHPGWPPQVSFARLRISNPEWAKTPDLVDARDLAARVEIPPLLHGRVVVPVVEARAAEAGLEQRGEQATWRFGGEGRNPSRIELGGVVLGDGHVVYRDYDE